MLGGSASNGATFPLGDIHDFTPYEARKLLHNKFVVILGDSRTEGSPGQGTSYGCPSSWLTSLSLLPAVHRSIYRDMIYFLQTPRMLSEKQLKLKIDSFANDCQVEGGKKNNKTSYCEVRQYRTDHHLVRFYFLTRGYSAYVESILGDFTAGPVPDVVIVNSCLWDLNRYNDGPSSGGHLEKAFREYWQNLDTLLGKLKDALPTDCLVIWDTAMPLGKNVQHAYLEPGMINESTPLDVVKANFYSATLACSYAFDVLDLHYCFRFLQSRRYTDGVHWDGWVHRHITKLLLTHVADAWGVELGRRRRKAPGGLPPQPSPPEPYVFQSCSECDDDFPPFQFSPSNNPAFQCDFTSDDVPTGEFTCWEDNQLLPPYPEADMALILVVELRLGEGFGEVCGDLAAQPGAPCDAFWDPGPDAPNGQLLPPYFQPEMPRGAPQRPHNALVMRRRPFRRHPGAAPYAVPRFERPPFREWGPSY
ncbi:hypothetical protein lerEdw1_019948 [Lerista edwardsae]|nr:hypothetical protein lerEdw1_019948 [Lerista edwardsae]